VLGLENGHGSFLNLCVMCAQVGMGPLHFRLILGEGITVILEHFNQLLLLLFSQSLVDFQDFPWDDFYYFCKGPLIFFLWGFVFDG
jgi:hypothetical protein